PRRRPRRRAALVRNRRHRLAGSARSGTGARRAPGRRGAGDHRSRRPRSCRGRVRRPARHAARGAAVTVLDHVTVAVPAGAFAARLAFYDAALGALGLTRLIELVDEEEEDAAVEAAAWGVPDGAALLWLVTGEPATSGLHTRLRVDSRAQVETFHEAALRAGGTAHTAPRRWVLYRRGE